jgi:urease accessory protein
MHFCIFFAYTLTGNCPGIIPHSPLPPCSFPIERSLHLHLFLHVRSLLSSAVRLNLIGPYASTQLLLHSLGNSIDLESRRNSGLRSGVVGSSSFLGNDNDKEKGGSQIEDEDRDGGIEGDERRGQPTLNSKWDWAKDSDDTPAVTWPLGELLMCRHDMQHTRIFNS